MSVGNISKIASAQKATHLIEPGPEHTMSQRGLPLQLPARVLGQVELGEEFLVPRERRRQPHLRHRVARPEAHRQDVHGELQAAVVARRC